MGQKPSHNNNHRTSTIFSTNSKQRVLLDLIYGVIYKLIFSLKRFAKKTRLAEKIKEKNNKQTMELITHICFFDPIPMPNKAGAFYRTKKKKNT